MGLGGSVTGVQQPRGAATRVAVASDLRIFPDRGSEIFADLATQGTGRGHGKRGGLTVISMRPAGWPPMDMSKKQTGLDILMCCVCEFACGSDS